jgi:predicted nuclease of predicted toxin-antitoxin system
LTAPRFLIDENLSVRLSEAAHRRGFEATHIVHLGMRQWKDWNVLEFAMRGAWALVTNNAVEFRSRYRALDLHPGVVFLLPSVRRGQQLLLFEAALEDIAINPDLSNQALDVGFGLGASVVVRRYTLP